MKVNISIDDVTPHPLSSTDVLDGCNHLIDLFPDIQISLFVPTAYWRTIKEVTRTPTPLQISNFPKFCQTLRDLPDKNYEIGFHGHYHGIPGQSDNDEFQHLNYSEASEKINLMFEEVRAAGLSDKFKKIFRPPAWRLSPDSFKALADNGFELFALTDLPHIKKVYSGEENNHPCTFSNQYPPIRELKVEENCGIVYHACEWDRNYLSRTMITDLKNFLDPLTDKIEFCFLKEFINE